jgi:hypothetical protein
VSRTVAASTLPLSGCQHGATTLTHGEDFDLCRGVSRDLRDASERRESRGSRRDEPKAGIRSSENVSVLCDIDPQNPLEFVGGGVSRRSPFLMGGRNGAFTSRAAAGL